jgi:hypothetical protein
MTGDLPIPTNTTISRRAWIAASLAGWSRLGAAAPGEVISTSRSDLERELEAVRAVGREAGLGPFRHSVSAGFVVVGDVPNRFRTDALAICEALKAEFLEHFRRKGFALSRIRRRMTVVALADAEAYGAFLGVPRVESYGNFSVGSNRVVFYDARADDEPGGRAATMLNLRNLTHEVGHQLSFNTALLPSNGDAPHWLVEGLAMYGETFRPGRSRIGGLNRHRLDFLVGRLSDGEPWLELERLVTDDHLYARPDESGRVSNASDLAFQAYSQSWLLVHYLLSDPRRLTGFRAYLKTLHQTGVNPRPGRFPGPTGLKSLGLAGGDSSAETERSRRLDEARRYLGDLYGLDVDLRRRMRSLPRDGPAR